MRQRCLNRKHEAYSNYGGRNITICKSWIFSFENFFNDMGKRPIGMSLDRINNNEGYCKLNCRWATRKEQNNNNRRNVKIIFQGVAKTALEWAIEAKIKPSTFKQRFYVYKWPIEKCLLPKGGIRCL